MVIVTYQWADLIIWILYMKGQVDNSKCESMNEWACNGLIVWEGKCERTLKDG